MTITIYQQYDIFEIFKTKYENIYDTANYFRTCEGEFKARFNNHTIIFTPY